MLTMGMPVGERAGHGCLGGTVDQYPTADPALAGAGRRPVLLDDLPAHAGVRAAAQAISGGLKRS